MPPEIVMIRTLKEAVIIVDWNTSDLRKPWVHSDTQKKERKTQNKTSFVTIYSGD